MTAESLNSREGWFGRLVTAIGARVMPRTVKGSLHLTLPSGREFTIGEPGTGIEADLQLHSYAVLRRAFTRASVGFGEAFMAGDWSSSDPCNLLRFYLQNRSGFEAAGKPFFFPSLIDRLSHLRRANTKKGSRRNIAAHYDLGNDFYRLWLDSGMTYSSALFATPAMTLEEAQNAKYEAVLQALDLRSGQSVLEIGCGWGGFAEKAVQSGARVTGITLSAQQLAYARQRLGERADLRLEDYRDTKGEYDGIASIEMIEAVGETHWPRYFATLRDRLKPGGAAAIQAITIDEAAYPVYRAMPDFIQLYIFPGGMLPTPTIMAEQASRAGLTYERLQCFAASYARTLRLWRERFEAAWPEITRLGFDERFRRMWIYYLAYCEAGFAERAIDVGFYRLRRPL